MFLARLTAFVLALKRNADSTRGQRNQGGTAASEQPTQAKSWQSEQASGNYLHSFKPTIVLSFSSNSGDEKLHRFQARITSMGKKKPKQTKVESHTAPGWPKPLLCAHSYVWLTHQLVSSNRSLQELISTLTTAQLYQ